MKKNDFLLLSNLPDDYEYEIFTFNDPLYVIGRKENSIIAFKIENSCLIQIFIVEKNST